MMSTWDAVVVGAGPAGAVAAHELAGLGASVLLLDRSPFPRWKVCGACLSPGALSVLAALGLGRLPERLGAVHLSQFVLGAGARTVRLRLRGTVALSRHALDLALVEAAVERGSDFWSGARASLGEVAGDGRVVRVVRDGRDSEVMARVVIDATGLGRGLEDRGRPVSEPDPRSRIGLGATFDDADKDASYPIESGVLHMVVGRQGYVGLVRVQDGTLNVAAAVDPASLRTAAPEEVVANILAEADRRPLPVTTTHGWRGTPLLTRANPDVGAERLFRLGDAAGYVEPFTGEGMGWALSGGREVARLARSGIDGWDDSLLTAWRRHSRHQLRRSQRLCRALAAALRRPRLVGAAVAALKVAPGLAAPFVRRAARAPGAPAVRVA